jgi:hypothetical protein
MIRNSRRALGLGILLALLLLGGCSRQLSQKTLYPTRGRVQLRGEPAAFVIVHLEPTSNGKGVSAEGMTKKDGTFELRTYSNEEPDGAAAGEYHVILEEFDPIRAVGVKIPPGAKPTPLPTTEWNTGVVIDVESQDNDLQITLNGDERADSDAPAAGGR